MRRVEERRREASPGRSRNKLLTALEKSAGRRERQLPVAADGNPVADRQVEARKALTRDIAGARVDEGHDVCRIVWKPRAVFEYQHCSIDRRRETGGVRIERHSLRKESGREKGGQTVWI